MKTVHSTVYQLHLAKAFFFVVFECYKDQITMSCLSISNVN